MQVLSPEAPVRMELFSGARPVCANTIPGERAGFLPHPRDLREVVVEGLDTARGLAPVVVLVGGVVAVLGEAETDADDRRLEVLLHGDDGADRAALADERGGGAEAE